MIFTINPMQSEQWLKETGSNWLLRETEELGELSLDYIGKDGKLESILLYLTKEGWQTIDELDTDNESQSENSKPEITLPTKEELQVCIIKILLHLSKEKKIDWLVLGHVTLFPEEERTKQPMYASYCDDVSREKKTPSAPLAFNIENWVHRLTLHNCLLDKRLYPFQVWNEKVYIANNSRSIYFIRNELFKLLKNQQPKLDNSFLSHPYYKKIEEAFNYRVNRILNEFSLEQIDENRKLAAEYNKAEKLIKDTAKLSKESKSVSIETDEIKLSDGNYAYSATCIGDRTYQEDRVFAIGDIKLHPTWIGRIPELIIYTIQQLAAEIYEKFPSESSEQSIGTTLSLAFIYKKAYVAWLGDSSIIRIKRNNIDKTVETDYLYWPHHCNQRPSENQEILVKQEEKRVEKELGAIVIKGNAIRLNGFLTVTRSLGDKCPGLGNGISDIPSIIVTNDFNKNEEDTLILASDGLTDHLLLQQLEDIIQTSPIANLAKDCCNTAYSNAPDKKSDNTTLIILQNCSDGVFFGVLDGHAQKNGHLFAEYASKNLPQKFKMTAEMEAPQPVAAIKSEVNMVLDPNCTSGFFSKKNPSKKRETQGLSNNNDPTSMENIGNSENKNSQKKFKAHV